MFWLGVALGLGLLAKVSVGVLLLPALWVLWLRREDQTRRLLRDLVAVGALVLILAGWFYAYRWVVYGDPLATNAWKAMQQPNSDWRLSDLFWFKHAQ